MIILFATTIAYSQSNDFTDGFPNGRYWNNSSNESKLFYLLGLDDAFSISRVFLNVKKNMPKIGLQLYNNYSAKNYTNSEISNVIDSVYSKIEFLILPIRDVASIILERYSGVITEKEMYDKFQTCLKIYVK